MELLFRRHFWVFHVLFLALAAWLVAGAVNAIVGSILKGAPEVSAGASGGGADREAVRSRNYNVANEANIFGALREDLTVPEAECEEDKDCPTGSCQDGQCVAGEESGPLPELADAVKSELRGRLVGTAVFADPAFSVASIVDENDGKNAEAGLYSINPCKPVPPAPPPPEGDDEEDEGQPIAKTLQDPCNELMSVATLKYIEPNRVYFYNRDEKRWEYFELGEEPEGKAVLSRRKAKPKADKKDDDAGKGIKKTGDNTYEVEQSEVDKALGNLSSLATQARIVPAFEGGKPVGFKLFSIRPNSLYSKIGVQNGDVIKRINGYEINSPDKALEIYQKLKDSKNVTVDLKRRGKPMTLEYGIVP